MPLTSKLPDVGTTIFTVMSKLAADHGAINLSQGYPDFDGPPELLERVTYYLNHGYNQYAPMPGLPQLREQIATKVATLYDCEVDAESEVTITSGATVALFCAITALVHEGDEVIVFDPVYDSYQPAVDLCGGITRHVPLLRPTFTPDWDRVANLLSDKTRMIIINTPHNPSGGVWKGADIEALRSVLGDRDIYLLADEVYEHIIFDGVPHQSLLRYPDLFQRSLVVSSFGKTYHTTGWKMGYCVAPQELMTEFRKVHQYVNFVSNTPIQHGLADYMASHPQHVLGLPDFYQRKRDLFCALLDGSRFGIRPSGGTYFQLLDYSAISNEADVDLARRLTMEAGVASIPISVFYSSPEEQRDLKVLRFCFAKDDATLAKAAEILCKL